MAKRNKTAGMTPAAQQAQAQNTATEFASETNAAAVRSQNQQSAARAAQQAQTQNTATEFASETNVAEVRKQNQQSASRSAQQNNINQ